MSFRARLYGSVTRTPGVDREISRSTLATSLNAEKSFTARDSRRSLTRNEFEKLAKSNATPLGTEEEAERRLGFAFSRTTRKNLKAIFDCLRSAGDSAEEVLSGLCGASALSDIDLVRLTAIDCDAFKGLLVHQNVIVRRAAVNVCAQIATRLWEWFASDAVECVEELESSQQDLRSWCIQLFRAIADRTTDEDTEVAALSFIALDLATLNQGVLFERVARHLIPNIGSLVKNCSRVRVTSAIRFTSKVVVLALSECGISGIDLNRNQHEGNVTTAHAFIHLVLRPLIEASEGLPGDICLVAAECSLDIIGVLAPWSAYDFGMVATFCANGALQRLLTLDLVSELPDSCRISRKRRWTHVLLRTAESSGSFPNEHKVRILGNCAMFCSQDPLLDETLALCASYLIDIECSHPGTLRGLIEDDRGILRHVWLGPEKPRHRLAAALLRAATARCPTASISSDRRRAWLDLSLGVLECLIQCITWGDSSFLNHFAGQMYINLLGKRAFFPVIVDCEEEIERSLAMEKFLRNMIAYRLKTVTNSAVRAGLLGICERAFCLFSSPDSELGQILVDASRHLALTSETQVAENHPLDPENPLAAPTRLMFAVAIDILSHLASSVPSLRNAVAEAFGYLSTHSSKLSAHEQAILEESIKKLERTGSLQQQRADSHDNELLNNWDENSPQDEGQCLAKWPLKPSWNSGNQTTLPEGGEKQLSGGHDPVYIIGRWRFRSDTRVDLVLDICNVSSVPLQGLDISVSCRGPIKVDVGFDHSVKFFKEISPGSRTIIKFGLVILEDGFGFAARRGVNIRVELDSDKTLNGNSSEMCSYVLPTWWLSPCLFLMPHHLTLESFRYIWGRHERVGISKCEAAVRASPNQIVEAFSKCRTFALIGRSSRILFLGAQTKAGDHRVLLTIYLQEKSETETIMGVSMRCKPVNKLALVVPGFDIREFISELLPSLATRIIWSGAPTWPGTMPPNGSLDELDELICSEASWSAAPSELPIEGDSHPSLSTILNSIQRWKSLQI